MSVERAGNGDRRWHSMNFGSVATVWRNVKTGLNRSTWPTCRTRFFFCASSHNSAACSELSVIGFSTRTCLPCASNCLAMSKCVVVGVTMFSASLAAAASAMEVKTCSLCFSAILRAVSLREQLFSDVEMRGRWRDDVQRIARGGGLGDGGEDMQLVFLRDFAGGFDVL